MRSLSNNNHGLIGIVALLAGGAIAVGLFGLFGQNIVESVIPWSEIFHLIIIISLCPILIAGLKYIQNPGVKFLFVATLGTGIAFFIFKLLGYV